MNSVKRADAADGSIEDSPLVVFTIPQGWIIYKSLFDILQERHYLLP